MRQAHHTRTAAGLVLLVIALAAGTVSPVRAQGGPEDDLPACTAADLRPLVDISLQMLEATSRARRYDVSEMLVWRTAITTLEVPACAEAQDIWLQLWLASDEILIGTLLLERQGAIEEAALAINSGLATLTALRYSFTLAGQAGGFAPEVETPEEFGALTGDDVLIAFQRFDLPYADVTREAGPAGGDAPDTELERLTFTLPTIFDGGVGQALVFETPEDRDAWLDYLFDPAGVDPGFVYFEANVIVQLSPDLDGETARLFRAALASLVE